METLKRLDQWPTEKDGIDDDGDRWGSDSDFKFLHEIADAVGCADAGQIAEVYNLSDVVRDKVAARIDYHIEKVLSEHVFACGFPVDDGELIIMEKQEPQFDAATAEVRKRLAAVPRGNHAQLEDEMKEIKKDITVSLGAQRQIFTDMMKEGINHKWFEGEIVWEPEMGLFAEVLEDKVKFYSKDFKQTVSGLTGIAKADLGDIMAGIPNKYVVYKPDEAGKDLGEDTVNVYRGPVFKGKGKKLPKNIGRVLDNLFLSDPAAREIFINWMAFVIQKRKRSGVAWGFFGAAGSGKGIISEVMRELVGRRNASFNVSDVDLQSSFNPYAVHKLFIHLNEVASDFHGRHGVAGKLKAMIGDPSMRVNQKGIPEIEIDNYANVILNSNKPNPIELDPDDRRWNMIVSAQALKVCDWWIADKSYDIIMSEVEALGAYLMNYEVNEIAACTVIEKSKAKQQIVELTTSPLKLLGVALDSGDLETILELVDMLEDDMQYKEVEEANSSGKWPNHLLVSLMMRVTGDQNVTSVMMSRRLATPYMKGAIGITMKIEGEAVRGRRYNR